MEKSDRFWLVFWSGFATFVLCMALIIAVHNYEKAKMMAEQGLVEVWDPATRVHVWTRVEDSK